MISYDDMIELLDSFNTRDRRYTLLRLKEELGDQLPAEEPDVNMHFHSFFSYNAEEWSPTRIAWESRKEGLYAAGLCDFDGLDGLEEFIHAGHLLGLRTAVHLETRVFLNEYAQVDINSPGEPGVTYIMGAGFARLPEAGTPQARQLAEFKANSHQRNRALIQRINAGLPEIALDYELHVLPDTPGGYATERHIISAYLHHSKDVLQNPVSTTDFWARILGKDTDETIELLSDTATMEETIRAKLAKRGGIGYEAPSQSSFPPADTFIRWASSCQAIPMITWLDGTSAGERDARAMLECLTAKGAAAVNIIPDRNWNIADPASRAAKIANLNTFVQAADAMHLPVNIGTEMNKAGLPFCDDLECDALRPHKEVFMRGARIMVGQTLLSRYANFAYTGAAAAIEYPAAAGRNRFFEAVGARPAMTLEQAQALEEMGHEKALAWFHDAVAKA